MTPQERYEIASRAEAISKDPIFDKAVTILTKDVIVALASTEIGSPQALALHAKLIALGELKGAFTSIASDKAFAERDLRRDSIQE